MIYVQQADEHDRDGQVVCHLLVHLLWHLCSSQQGARSTQYTAHGTDTTLSEATKDLHEMVEGVR